jgi:CRP-like cAMP-binding protein
MLPLIERLRLLRRFDLFAELPAEDLLGIAQVVEQVEHAAGDVIFAKGDPGHELFLVARGRVRIVDGPTTIVVLGEGEFFGDLAVIDHQPRSAGAVCETDVALLRLRGADMDELLAARPKITEHFLRVIARRLRDVTRRLSG